MGYRKFLVRVRNGLYLPVAARLLWFRSEHPDWSIETQPLHLDFEQGMAVFQATVKDPSGRVIAIATKAETRSDFADFVEKAETGAVGRALAMCGYGTQFALELSEGDFENEHVAFADAPVPVQDEPMEAPMECADCGKALRKPQYDLSMAKFQRPLCPNCQRAARTRNANHIGGTR